MQHCQCIRLFYLDNKIAALKWQQQNLTTKDFRPVETEVLRISFTVFH